MHTSSRLTFCNKTQQHQLFTINLKHRMNAQYFMLIYIDDHNMDSDWSIKRNIRWKYYEENTVKKKHETWNVCDRFEY